MKLYKQVTTTDKVNKHKSDTTGRRATQGSRQAMAKRLNYDRRTKKPLVVRKDYLSMSRQGIDNMFLSNILN